VSAHADDPRGCPAAASWPATSPGFGRALRRAGVRVDSAPASRSPPEAASWSAWRQGDLAAAMEAVLVSREQDREVFRELFDAYFRDPELAHKLLAQMLPSRRRQGASRRSAGRA
jgi:uncharacterized protein with von Willebrand factor type A (vWA) domain